MQMTNPITPTAAMINIYNVTTYCRGIFTQLPAIGRFVTTFVPCSEPANESQMEKLQEFVDNSANIMILTGAGLSTESGIPDYRSEGVGLYARSKNRPIQHQEFMKSKDTRQRYWARNFMGWPTFSSFLPNASHLALARWQTQGKISALVTQNVDRLHHKAGSEAIELHGTLYQVTCMNCNFKVCRHDFQKILLEMNPHLSIQSNEIRPDGDVELSQETINQFRVPHCSNCNDKVRGILKTDVVFFGDNVPKTKVDLIYSHLESSDSLLIVGSSLQVYSGYRFILRAHELGKTIAIVNIGATRGDKFAHIKLNSKCSDILSKICI